MFGWLTRKTLLYVALVAAILFYWSTRPSFESFRQLRETAAALSDGEGELLRHSTSAVARSNADVATFHRWSHDRIDNRIATARREREPLARACGSDLGALVTRGAAGVIDNREKCLRASLLTREIDTLTAMRISLDARRPGESLAQALRRHAATMRRIAAVHRDARARLDTFDNDRIPDILQYREMQQQRARIAQAESEYYATRRNANTLIAARRSIDRATDAATRAVELLRRQYRALVEDRAKALSDNVFEKARSWAETSNLFGAMKLAAGLIALGIISNYLIRVFCYFVLAPALMRGRAIRLPVPAGAVARIPPVDRSTTSVGIRLGAGEELLVRQDYLQTTSHAGSKGTQWFLNWRVPVTSMATGLWFLTRIRGEDDVTTVSAVRDPFAEVTVLTLPEGASCVLHPRALAAVAQPIRQPLRVETRWRIRSLAAWLTMQLRYVVFHGPARLVLKGGRGVRVERAERGRIFGQDQLVGFSTDFAYSVTRTETFWPYFLGRTQLLKDRVADGVGVLIVEEAPMAGRRAGRVRGGIEGLIDAGMKAFGM